MSQRRGTGDIEMPFMFAFELVGHHHGGDDLLSPPGDRGTYSMRNRVFDNRTLTLFINS